MLFKTPLFKKDATTQYSCDYRAPDHKYLVDDNCTYLLAPKEPVAVSTR